MNVTKAMRAMTSPPRAGDARPQPHSRCLTWEPVMSTGKRLRTATMRMRMRMRRKMPRKPMMDQRRIWSTDLETSDVNGYECEDGDNADTHAQEEPSQADEGSTQNVED
jgi:hypothetical protein